MPRWAGPFFRSCAGRPPRSEPRRWGTILRVSDTCPPGPQKREPRLEHLRDVWMLYRLESTCTAAIWRNDFVSELRVLHGELIESRLSRYGEAPFLPIAEGMEARYRLTTPGHDA